MSVAQNTVINMGEDLTMMVGYSVVNQWLHDKLSDLFPPELDENGKPVQNIALEVLSGGASFLFMSSMMEVIRREEKFIEYLFVAGEAVIDVLYARNKGFFDGMKSKIMGLRGVKAVSKMKTLNSQTDQTNSFVGQVYQAMQAIMQGRNSSHDVANTISASNSSQDTAINREAHNLKFAELHNKSFSSSLFIKTATGSFTVADKVMLQKMIGRTEFSTVPLNVDEFNKVHEFLYVKDSNGKMVALTNALMSWANGMGFIK
ncbi:hypothetical protein Sulku_1338 [Sulfuricurvum kujiense DSM 16994]|uniref:Uncharacterized protein n=1 Tax=Sulfuricurvum kujiense (strain ATCC BAA-921 / DSM 16994 / JCM 11577 / YK-1) TaxID=709032 RepID=E4TY81_SULKY|nr:hypothetical protein [Sulfuricurvum kujiense]ADR34001.1 hypothetical protein Sulku_1338 [Sulfuricurvum kujiense DSM 16994]